MRIIALFNLKDGVDPAAYEEWARRRDIPGVRALPSVVEFEVLRATGVLFGDEKPPFDYFEVLDIVGMDDFMKDVSGEAVTALAQEMGAFTDKASFVTTEQL